MTRVIALVASSVILFGGAVLLLIGTATTPDLDHPGRPNGVSLTWASPATLDALTLQINRDARIWRAKGIDLSAWGPDPEAGTVTIALRKYSSAAAIQLVLHYGHVVSVAPGDLVVVGIRRG